MEVIHMSFQKEGYQFSSNQIQKSTCFLKWILED